LPRGYDRIRFRFALTVLSLALAGQYGPFPNAGFDALNDVKLDPLINQFSIPSFGRFGRDRINSPHVAMASIARMPVVPLDRYVSRARRFDGAPVCFGAVEAHAVAGF
jgi:hypothetical protein